MPRRVAQIAAGVRESAIKAKYYITIGAQKGRGYRVLASFSFIAEISVRPEIAARPIVINRRSRITSRAYKLRLARNYMLQIYAAVKINYLLSR